MRISLRPEHLKRYRDLAVLIAKYGRPGLIKQVGLDDAIEDAAAPTDESPKDAKELGPMVQILRGDRSTYGDSLSRSRRRLRMG